MTINMIITFTFLKLSICVIIRLKTLYDHFCYGQLKQSISVSLFVARTPPDPCSQIKLFVLAPRCPSLSSYVFLIDSECLWLITYSHPRHMTDLPPSPPYPHSP